MHTLEICFEKLTLALCGGSDVMKNLSLILGKLGNSSTAALTIGNITGLIAKLPKENQTGFNFVFTETAGVKVRCCVPVFKRN